MRDFHLRFYWDATNKKFYKFKKLFNLLAFDENKDEKSEEISDELKNPGKGVYVLGADEPHMFKYPWGSSPVFYIGKSEKLYERLIKQHKVYIERAIENYEYVIGANKTYEELNWLPRYQYGAAFGCYAAWYNLDDSNDINCLADLEARILNHFYFTYGALPVANGAWPTGLNKPTNDTRYDDNE